LLCISSRCQNCIRRRKIQIDEGVLVNTYLLVRNEKCIFLTVLICPKNDQIRVVVAGKKPPPVGGQNLLIAELIKDLQKDEKFQVEHLDFSFTKDWKNARKLNFSKIFELLNVWNSIRRISRSGKVDLLLFPVGGPQKVPLIRDTLLLPLIRPYCRKLVLHFHAAGYARIYGNLFTLLRGFSKSAYSLADEAIVMTCFGSEDAVYAGVKKIHVCPNVIVDTYAPTKLKTEIRNSIPRILYLGHVYEEKGVFDLLNALQKVKSHFRLRIVGDCLTPWTPKKLLDWIAEKGLSNSVEYVGCVNLSKRDDELLKADFLVFPSRAHESFGLVLAEAMMWKLPIVTFDWRGNKEVVGENPGGVIMPFGDNVTQLASAVEYVLKNRDIWLQWGEINRERFLQKFRKPEGRPPLADLLLQIASS